MSVSVEPEGTVFDHVFDFFGSARDLGVSWGGPWGILLPLGILAFALTSIFWGVCYTTEFLVKDIFKKLLIGIVVLAGLYILAALNP